MKHPNKLENMAAYNEEPLQELKRTILLSQGSFSLIYCRCNYNILQEQILDILREECPAKFRVLELPKSATNLYTNLSDRFQNNPPDALMVLGLESVGDLERLLAATNNVRDSFLGFPFPIVIWGTDALFKILRRRASDFNSFATAPIPFALPDDELAALICRRVNAAVDDADNFQIEGEEIEALGRDLEERELVLDGETQACFAFLLGRHLAGIAIIESVKYTPIDPPKSPLKRGTLNCSGSPLLKGGRGGSLDVLHRFDDCYKGNIDAAVDKYRESLLFWQQNNDLEKRGLVLLNLGLLLEKKGEDYWQQAVDYLGESLQSFELANRGDLVGKYLGYLGQLFRKLKQWDELKILAEKGLSLHESLGKRRLVAIDYGWLAEAALKQSNCREAVEFAEKALAIADPKIAVKERALFRFLLGQSLAELGKVPEAISCLEKASGRLKTAREQNLWEYDAKLHVDILQKLRIWQSQEKQYLEAFNNKQLQRQVESQYGWRAFVGAGRLQPPAIILEGKNAEERRELVRQIAAFSGRKADLERLLDRIKNRDKKLIVIYGQSGVGKSSILQAGLIPLLQLNYFEGRDYLPVSVGVYQNWVNSLGQELVEVLSNRNSSPPNPPSQGGDRKIPPNPPSQGGNSQSPPSQGGFRGIVNDRIPPVLSNSIPPNPPSQGGDRKIPPNPPSQGGDRKIPPNPPSQGGDRKIPPNPPSQGGDSQSPPSQGGFRGIVNPLRQTPETYIDGVDFSPEWILSELRENESRGLFTILIFDQFEEFFFDNPDAESRREFYKFLEECLSVPYLKVILSLREDYIYYLLEFSRKAKLDINKNYENILYYLGNFSPEDAKAAIISLTESSKITLDSDLVEELVEDLGREFDGVRPIEFQVVGAQLESKEITTLKQYRQQGENPKEILVEQFLEDAVKDCGKENQRAAELVLYLLTNTENTRPLKTLRELKEDLEIEEEKLDLVLKVLVGSGLVLLVPEKPENFYQLVHDYLVAFVRQKYEPQSLELQREKEERRRAEKRLLVVSVAASMAMAVLAGTSAIFGVQSYLQSQKATQQGIEAIKQSSMASANEFQALTLSERPLEARLAAVKAGGQLLNNNLYPPTNRLSIVTDILRQLAYKKEGELFREANRLAGHEGWVWGVSFSPDGELIASASSDNTVKLWSREGKLLQTLSGHEAEVLGVSFSPDGESIASASSDNTVKLWSREGKLLQTLSGHEGPVNGVSFSPDGELIASASRDKTVKLWSPQGKLLQTLSGHEDSVWGVSFSPDGELIASASRDKTVKLWSREGKLLQTLSGYEGSVWGVSFSPDGELIASASFDNTVKLWSREGKLLQTLSGHEGSVWGVSFSPDGELIASASRDNTVKLWSREGKLLQTLSGHEGSVIGVSFSPDGELIASASRDNTVKLWSRKGKLLQTLSGHEAPVLSVSFSPDGELIASAGRDNTVKLWSREGKLLQTLSGHEDWVIGVSFSPDGELIASAGRDNTVKLWSREGKLLQTLSGHEAPVLSVSFSPDGELIASASSDKTVKLWSREGKLLQTLSGHEAEVLGVSFSPDGELIASASDDKTVKLWSPQGKLLQTLSGHEDWVIGVSFSPDGELIATASSDKTVKLWSREGKLLQTLSGHEAPVWGVSFSPDGELIASASDDKTVKLWSPQGKLLQTLSGHEAEVRSVSFSPDGELIASASNDNTVKLWSRQGELLQTLSGHEAPVWGVSFSPDGELIASASRDNTVKLWDVWDLSDLMKLNCQLVGDYLRNNQEVQESDRGLCDSFDLGE
ncbi:MAG: ribosome assembly protein 4 [Cyanobacteriota bacterium]|nr:ribosome assembly protein 4 [Cyanobacteriota bacterium]